METIIIGIGRFFIIDQFILFLQRTGLAEAGVSFQDLQKLGLIGENEGSDQYHLHKAFIIPLKINPWKGKTRNQYKRPFNPSGRKVAVCSSSLFSLIKNSSHASPGNFISAYNSNLRSSLLAINTLQKSSDSPGYNWVGLLLPRRKPTPPTILSIKPLIPQSHLP